MTPKSPAAPVRAPLLRVEVRKQHTIGQDTPALDEVCLYVDGRCVFHLEQMSETCWWMGVGDPDSQYVHVRLSTKRATISGDYEDQGEKPAVVMVDGKVVEE